MNWMFLDPLLNRVAEVLPAIFFQDLHEVCRVGGESVCKSPLGDKHPQKPVFSILFLHFGVPHQGS